MVTSSTPSPPLHVAAGAVTGEKQDDEHQECDRHDEPEHLHPAWSAGRSRFGQRLLLSKKSREVYETACIKTTHHVKYETVRILWRMPRLWTATVEAHRQEVGDAIMHTTTALVHEHGLRSVTMSQIAKQVGIGRATLYKYFPSVEAILLAWHERRISDHLEHLAHVRDHAGAPMERLQAVLEAYALVGRETRDHHDDELAAFLHRDKQVRRAEDQVRHMIRDLIAECVRAGLVRGDIEPEELANFCLHALAAGRGMRSKPAVERLVRVILDGLRARADVPD
jgi:AcrR family transcriptional regulator